MGKKLLALIMFSMAGTTQAADNLTFKGNLIIPNCTVNGGASLETDFNDVEIQTMTAINVGYHAQPLNISVVCPYNSGIPKIKLSGAKATGNVNAVQTSKYNTEKLIILFTEGGSSTGTKIPLGSYKNLATGSVTGNGSNRIVKITASLGREGDLALLTPGPFTAAANMELRYE